MRKPTGFFYGKLEDFMLEHISFQVPKGHIVGFIGENGAGKSTTINLILEQLKRDDGEIEILGKQNYAYLHKENIGVLLHSIGYSYIEYFLQKRPKYSIRFAFYDLKKYNSIE